MSVLPKQTEPLRYITRLLTVRLPAQAIARADVAQPITPLPLSVVFLNPPDPLLMCKHGKLRTTLENRPPSLQSVNSTPAKSGIKGIVPLIHRHRRHYQVVSPRLCDTFGQGLLTEQLIAVPHCRAVTETSQGFFINKGCAWDDVEMEVPGIVDGDASSLEPELVGVVLILFQSPVDPINVVFRLPLGIGVHHYLDVGVVLVVVADRFDERTQCV